MFGYTGKYFDEVTGLQNNWNRWYDPKQGRFISQDPIGFAGGDENLYRYVGNSPTNYKDSNGLWGEPVNSTEYGKIDEKGYYIEGGGWDFDGLVLQNGYEVPSNYPGWMFGSFAAYTVWPMLGYRKVGQPAGPSVLNLEASRNAIINHRNQAAAGQTGNSSHHPGVHENELIAIETLVETDLLFYEIGSGLAAASGGFSGPGAFGRAPQPSGTIGTTAPSRAFSAADTARFSEIRSTIRGIGNKRNVAFAEGHVGGKSIGEIVGVSGKNTPGAIMPSDRIFKTGIDEFDRAFDAEVFVLENLTRKLKPGDSGTIKLVSELPFCDSCSDVIRQFREMFPNIRLILIDGT